jgi:hypothetical protein
MNPFDRYDIDPELGVRGITERFRELTLDASESERVVLRAAWEELTMHPARRLAAAMRALPETRVPLGAEPAEVRARADVRARGDRARVDLPLALEDLALWPSIAHALGDKSDAPRDSSAQAMTLEDDPILVRPTDVR